MGGRGSLHCCLASLVAVAQLLLLAGCGGGGGGEGGSLLASQPSDTGTFRADPVNVLIGDSKLVGIGRGFVTLDQGRPTAVGLELSTKAVRDLPLPDDLQDPPAVFGVALPPESAYTPFTYISVSPLLIPPAEEAHRPNLEVVFGIGPPQTPVPPQFARERAAVAAPELPQDHVVAKHAANPVDVLSPGVGVLYEDPAAPQRQPGWDSTGQAYYFYNGHLNGISIRATRAFLNRQREGREPARSEPIKQPQTYPKPGFYPRRYTVRYDAERMQHLFVLEDFQSATAVVAQRPLRPGAAG